MNVTRQRGFTLMEMLVVIGILAVLGGMMAYNFARPEVRREQVRLAAEELAATFRKARVLAMERKTVHAVVFHIQNDPASSGIVLNNRSGGHWYRMMGPTSTDTSTNNSQSIDDLVPLSNNGGSGRPHSIAETEELVRKSWIEESHVLPIGQVRFLALSDMDFGDAAGDKGSYRGIASHDSYPRPWFGWYDSSAKRLFPWGGYDPAIAGSGFFYHGSDYTIEGIKVATADPPPIGSTHSVTRILDRWIPGESSNKHMNMDVPSFPASDTLYEAGTPRPVINSEWRDACLIFLSTGEVRWGDWLEARHAGRMTDGISKDGIARRRGVYDRCNGIGTDKYGNANQPKQHIDAEIGNFDQDTGGWYITLAPDAKDDNDRFETAEAAMASVAPMYRVFVSRLGDVQVIPVLRKADFQGYAAFPPDASWWRTASNLKKYFPADRYVDGSKLGSKSQGVGVVTGKPIVDFVTPEMLTERQVWMK